MEASEDEVLANLERAGESVRAADQLLNSGFCDFAASRAYYAAFYAITAALLVEGFEFKRHSGAIAAVHRHFVKTGRLDMEHGKNLNWLFELRSVGDYGETRHVPREDAKRAVDVSAAFVAEIRRLLGTE